MQPADARRRHRTVERARCRADARRWILGYAILAPHSHNLLSWLVDLGAPDEILLRCDLMRLLPETDPYSRQIISSVPTSVIGERVVDRHPVAVWVG